MKQALIQWTTALLALASAAAGATDIAATVPGAVLPDGQMVIGRRTMALPPGQWTYAARSEGFVRHDGVDRKGVHYTGYAMNTDGSRMLAAVTLRLTLNGFPLNKRYVDEPCKVTGHIFRDDFDSGFDRPRCLVVYKRRTHLAESHEGLYGQAAQWMRAQGIRQPGRTYEIVYTNLAANDFGILHVFLPAASVDGDEAAIAWAKQLPSEFESFFANTQTFALLPRLPKRASP